MKIVIRDHKRRGADRLSRSISYLAAIAWLIIFVVFAMLSTARSPQELFVYRNLSRMGDRSADMLMRFALVLLIIVLAISIMGIVFNASRHRRKTDRYSKALIISAVLSLMAIVVLYIL